MTALELAILAPALIVMMMLVVGFGRVAHGGHQAEQAASAAARAASLAISPDQAVHNGRAAAADTLIQAGISCRNLNVSVDVTGFHPSGSVEVTVRCVADLSAVAIAGFPGTKTFTTSSRAVLEPYRDLGATDTTAATGG